MTLLEFQRVQDAGGELVQGIREPVDRCLKRMIPLRAAFTVVELLVSITVVTVLVSLIVPAVMYARESARMTECRNRLRQFGVALHSFESAFRCLPALGTPGVEVGRPTFSPQARLLPYLGEPAAWAEIQRLNVDQNNHVGFRRLKITLPILQCPSDAVPTTMNYRVCVGAVPFIFEWGIGSGSGERAFPVGAFVGLNDARGDGRGMKLAEIRDGLSQTAAMSERLASDATPLEFDRSRDVWPSGAEYLNPAAVTDSDVLQSFCESWAGDPGTRYATFLGWHPAVTGWSNAGYNHVLTPSSQTVDCSTGLAALPLFDGMPIPDHVPGSAAVSARSLHSAGTVNLLFLDGAVQPQSSSIDLHTWRRIATVDDSRFPGD
jgi:type II secretory pathway pseudopilin PulG